MTTARQMEANRANARKSTGPRTKLGKARASRNARRHGLSIPVLADAGLAKDVEDLARKIVDENPNVSLLEPARDFSEAQVDLNRIRRRRRELFLRGQGDPGHLAVGAQNEPAVASPVGQGAIEKFVANVSNQVLQLARLDRYQRRALARRNAATRAFDAARKEGA
jgi:hypothetical protein